MGGKSQGFAPSSPAFPGALALSYRFRDFVFVVTIKMKLDMQVHQGAMFVGCVWLCSDLV